MKIKPWLTAIHRKNISAPLKMLLETNQISTDDDILDYGCGHGYDLNYLSSNGYSIIGYDKYIQTCSNEDYHLKKYNKILCFYVLNTISEEFERVKVIQNLLDVMQENATIYIAVRSEDELKNIDKTNLNKHNDGFVTKKNTFQKYFSKNELDMLLKDNFVGIKFTYIKFNNKTLFIAISQ